jgi:LysR family cys regulon transcriptional activator
MAVDETVDSDLIALPAGHLFESSVTHIGFRRGTFLRRYMYDFIAGFASHLTHEIVAQAVACSTRAERDALFADMTLPVR